jgi:hypothetical protein
MVSATASSVWSTAGCCFLPNTAALVVSNGRALHAAVLKCTQACDVFDASGTCDLMPTLGYLEGLVPNLSIFLAIKSHMFARMMQQQPDQWVHACDMAATVQGQLCRSHYNAMHLSPPCIVNTSSSADNTLLKSTSSRMTAFVHTVCSTHTHDRHVTIT